MFNKFSNEATAVVFDAIADKPELYERAADLVRREPAKAPQEIRCWVTRELKSSLKDSDKAVISFLEASLRTVRWEEIRLQLQEEAARH